MILKCQRIQLKFLKKAGAGNEGLDFDESSNEGRSSDAEDDDDTLEDAEVNFKFKYF